MCYWWSLVENLLFTVKYILQRLLQVFGQIISCTDVAMLFTFALPKKSEHFS